MGKGTAAERTVICTLSQTVSNSIPMGAEHPLNLGYQPCLDDFRTVFQSGLQTIYSGSGWMRAWDGIVPNGPLAGAAP